MEFNSRKSVTLPAPKLSAHHSRLQGQAAPHAHAAPAAAGGASQGVEQSPSAAAPQGPSCGPGQWWLASGSRRPPSASAPCGSPSSVALVLTPVAAAPRGLPGLPQPDPAAPAATSCEAHSAGGGTRHRGQGLEDRWPHQGAVHLTYHFTLLHPRIPGTGACSSSLTLIMVISGPERWFRGKGS